MRTSCNSHRQIEYDLADWDSELAYGRIVEGEVDAAEQSHLPAEESEDASSSSDVEMDATSSSRDDEESAE